MFLPIGDTPNPDRFTPFMTWGLIACNIAVFLFINIPLSNQFPQTISPLLQEYVRMLMAQGLPADHVQAVISHISLNDLLLFQYGYKPGNPSISSLFSSMFLHSGIMHLAGNMLFLYIYGDNVEHQLGRIKFLIMYLATGVIATLSFALIAGGSLTPLVGASGAISGVLGFYFYMFPKNKVKVLIILLPIFINVVRIPARLVLGIYVLVDNLLPVIVQAGSNVAYGAHLGGFFGGLGIAALGEYFGWRLPLTGGARTSFRFNIGMRAQTSPKYTEKSGKLGKALLSGDIETLLDALKDADAVDLRALSVKQIISIAKTLENNGFPTPANRVLKVALTTHKDSPLIHELYYELGRVRYGQGYTTAAYQHLLTALDLNPSSSAEEKIRELADKIESSSQLR